MYGFISKRRRACATHVGFAGVGWLVGVRGCRVADVDSRVGAVQSFDSVFYTTLLSTALIIGFVSSGHLYIYAHTLHFFFTTMNTMDVAFSSSPH